MKRILSFLLSLAMIISMLPAGAFAAEVETVPEAETVAATEAPVAVETEVVGTAEETEAAQLEEEQAAAEILEETVPPTEPAETWEAAEETAEEAVATAEDAFRAAIAAAEANGTGMTVREEITLTEDLTINLPGELALVDNARLVVSSGVTLTLNCPVMVNTASLDVREGGELVNNVSLTFVSPMKSGASFGMHGVFVNSGMLWVNEGADANISGTATSTGSIFVGFGSGGECGLIVQGTLSTSGYLCVANANAFGMLHVHQGATLNILNNENGCGYLDNTSHVQIDGTLNVDGLFTTGASRDDDGNVVGPDAYAGINGALSASGTSSIAVLSKGTLNVFGNMNADGEVVVEPEGALWIDGMASLNGVNTFDGEVHVDFIDEFSGNGVLNLEGTTSVTGYLAVHDGGTLNTGAASSLNILNNKKGCGYLDNQGSVTLNGRMNLEGMFTTGASRDDNGNVVGPDAVATNNGTIEGAKASVLGVGIGGTMNNNGTVIANGELIMDGSWKGNPVQGVQPEVIMSFEEFKKELEKGSVTLTAKVVIEEDLMIGTWMEIDDGGQIVVPEGVTLTTNLSVSIYDGRITVESGGTLVNNGTLSLYTEDSGLAVYGTYIQGNVGKLWAYCADAILIGVESGLISVSLPVQSEEELQFLMSKTEFRQINADMREPIRLTSDMSIPEHATLNLYNAYAELTVASGVTLSVDGDIRVYDAGITVEPGATLQVPDGGGVQLYNSYIHAEGATVDAALASIRMNLDGNSQILGVNTHLVNGTCGVETMNDLWKAVGLCSLYNFVEIDPQSSFTVESNLMIPDNSMFALYNHGELIQVIIPSGVTVVSYADIIINNNCQIWIQEGGTLELWGGLNDYNGNGLVVDGTFIDYNGNGGGGGESNGISSLGELKEAIASGVEWMFVDGLIYIQEELVIPAACTIDIYEAGQFVVGPGGDVTVEGSLNIRGGLAAVERSGSLAVGSMYIDGSFEVLSGGSFRLVGDSAVTVTYESEVIGIPKSLCILEYKAETEAEIREGLKIAGYNWVSVHVTEDMTLTSNLTVPAQTSLFVDCRWTEDGDESIILTVPKGKTITNNGNLVTSDPSGCLVIEEGAKFINKGTIYNRGILVNDGTIENQGEFYIYGELRGDGTITGDGFMDYARPVYNHADLEKWLAEKVVPTYLYVWETVTLEDDVTIPAGTQMIMEGSTLIVPSGVAVTMNGEMYAQYGGKVTFQSGSELICNNQVQAYENGSVTMEAGSKLVNKGSVVAHRNGTINVYGTYVNNDPEEYVLLQYETGSVNGLEKAHLYYMADFANNEEFHQILNKLDSEGYGYASVWPNYGIGVVELTGNITIPESVYFYCGLNYGDSLILKSGSVLDVYGTLRIYEPGTLTVEEGAELINHGTIDAYEGGIIYKGIGLQLLSGESRLVGGKGTTLKVQNTVEPGTALPASEIAWTLANAADSAYVTVTADGKVTTKAVQSVRTVTLICTMKNHPDVEPLEHTITIYPAATQVDLYDGGEIYTGRTLKLGRGQAIILNAKTYPADSMGDVTWEISDRAGKCVTILAEEPGYMVLESTGAKGTVTVKITAADGSKKSASVKIQTGVFVEQVIVSSPSIELVSGTSVQLNLEVKPADAANKAVVWSLADANDKQYVSVSSSGKVSAKKGLSMSKPVEIVATAKDGSGVYGSFTFQLQPADPGALLIMEDAYTNVTGTTVNVNLLTGGTAKLKAKYFNTDSADVTWSGKNVTFSQPDAEGYVTATVSGKGTYTVTAVDAGGKKATVKLKAANLSEGVSLSGPEAVASGKSAQFTASILPAGKVDEKKVNWWIDPVHTAYASISATGKLSAAKNLMEARNICVWAQCKDGNSEAEMITVDILPLAQGLQILERGVDVTNTNYVWDMAVDTGSPVITAAVFPADAGDGVVWKLSGAKVLQQNADGTWSVTGKTGTATVTATAADGSNKKASFKFTVVKSMEYIAQSQTELVVAGGKSLKMASFVTVDAQATNKNLNWTMSGDTDVATLSATGVLKLQKVTEMKTITVVATAADGSGCRAEFTVYVYPATTSVKLLCDGETAPKQATLGIGETLTLEGISLPTTAAQGPGAYTWKLSSDKFAALEENPDGTVTVAGKAKGTVTVTCTAADGTGKKATLKIKIG